MQGLFHGTGGAFAPLPPLAFLAFNILILTPLDFHFPSPLILALDVCPPLNKFLKQTLLYMIQGLISIFFWFPATYVTVNPQRMHCRIMVLGLCVFLCVCVCLSVNTDLHV